MAQPVTQQYRDSLIQGVAGNGIVVDVDVYSGGAPVAGYQDIPVQEVTISVDRKNATRATAKVVLNVSQENDYWPRPLDLADVLAPNGNELVIKAGYRYPDGTEEMFQMGVFPIVSVEANVNTQYVVQLTISADDRSWALGRRGILSYYAIPVDQGGNSLTTVDVAIHYLLTQANPTWQAAMPNLQFNISNTNIMAPANTYQQGANTWQSSFDLATSIGFELYMDRWGNVTSSPIPVPGSIADWSFTTENPNANILSLTRTLSADNVFNDIVVQTANIDTVGYYTIGSGAGGGNYYSQGPIEGGVRDQMGDVTDISSKFGDIIEVTASTSAVTADAAVAEANYDMLMSLGEADTLTLETTLNFAVDIDDVVSITCPMAGLNNALYVVDGYTSSIKFGGTTQYQLRRIIYGPGGTPPSFTPYFPDYQTFPPISG